jgi:ferritin-like protein
VNANDDTKEPDAAKEFHDLAQSMVEKLPRNLERTAGLRKLLEAKDCAVRSSIYRDDRTETR